MQGMKAVHLSVFFVILSHTSKLKTIHCAHCTCGTLSLIGHSAGGWLSRVYLEEYGSSNISCRRQKEYLKLLIRYIKGARFFRTEDINSKSTIPIPVQQPVAEVMIENGTSLTATSSGTTFRARFAEDINSKSTIPIPVQQPAAEVMIENGTSLTATSSGTTFRARFVGQGYKQKIPLKLCRIRPGDATAVYASTEKELG